MPFIKLAKFCVPVSILLVLASIVVFFGTPGPNVSIEFTGGTLMELSLPKERTKSDLTEAIKTFPWDRPYEENIASTKTATYFVKTPTLTTEQHTALLAHLKTKLGAITELQYTSIGPTVGQNLRMRAFWALGIAAAAIMAFVAFSFRRVPKYLNPWSFGISAIAALVHDILIMLGIFTILSHTTAFQIDTLFITALLSIMGHSVSDTIVIFDRIRETLSVADRKTSFAEIADRALNQVISRTVNTGIGMLIMLVALFLFGSESIRWFMLALIIGTVVGMYSSYFIATPILVIWRRSRTR